MKIKDLLGANDYATHKNLITHLFSNENNFYVNNQIDYTKIMQELDKNGVLKSTGGANQTIIFSFSANKDPKKTIKNISEILKAMGQYNFITKEEIVVDNNLKWTIEIKTAAAISPLFLYPQYNNLLLVTLVIIWEGNSNWNYSLNTNNSSVYKAEDLIENKQLSLKKPLKPYMIKISGAKVINIKSVPGNIWYPSVVFYNDSLNIIGTYQENSLQKSLKLEVPKNTKYIKIDDLYTLANIKQGLNITKE